MSITKSTQFYVKEIVIQSKGGPVPIKDLVEEINFYDNLFLPVSSGEILITDAAKLLERISPINDPIQFYISKTPNDEVGTFKKVFRVYEITNRKNLNNNSETYIMHFVADEFVFSKQKKLSFGFNGKYSKLVEKILTDKTADCLGLSRTSISKIEESNGIRSLTIPNLPPLPAIEWCSKRALNPKNVPDFVFYSNMAGYNFVSLSTLLKQEPILDINFSPKNLKKNSGLSEMSQARGFEVVSQADAISRIQNGVDTGVFIGFDPLTRSVGQTQIDGNQVYNAMDHANRNQIPSEIVNSDNTTNKTNLNANQVLSINNKEQKNSKYTKDKDPTSLSKNETLELFLQQRKAIITRLMEKRIRIVMPGNFQLSSGYIVNIVTPGFGASSKQEDPNFDRSLGGKYLIVGTRHILSGSRHVTVIEVATDSTNDTRKPTTTQNQKDVLAGYDRDIKVNNGSSSYWGR